jgi:hypothetical protein
MSSSASIQAPSPVPEDSTPPGNSTKKNNSSAHAKPQKFTEDQKAYLESYADAFLAVCSHLDKTGAGPRKVKGNKGSKKDWVERQVIPGFITKFQLAGSGGPSLSGLSSVCTSASYSAEHLLMRRSGPS